MLCGATQWIALWVWFKSVNPYLISSDDDCNEVLPFNLMILFKHTSLDIVSTLSDLTSNREFEFILI